MKLPSLALAVLLACLSSATKAAELLASIRPLALIAEEIAGDALEVDTLLSSHQDPHGFALRPSDLRRINQAELLIWVGPDLERFLVKPYRGKNTFEISTLFEPKVSGPLNCDPHDDHIHCRTINAHLWLGPDQVKEMMKSLAADLAARFPIHAEYFKSRLDSALGEMDRVIEQLKESLSSLDSREFGSAHDAYDNFTQAFDLKQKLAVSVLPEQRLSARRMREVKDNIKGASCLLIESGDVSGRRLAHTLAVPAVETDILASSAKIKNIYDFFIQLGKSFENCLSYPPTK